MHKAERRVMNWGGCLRKRERWRERERQRERDRERGRSGHACADLHACECARTRVFACTYVMRDAGRCSNQNKSWCGKSTQALTSPLDHDEMVSAYNFISIYLICETLLFFCYTHSDRLTYALQRLSLAQCGGWLW